MELRGIDPLAFRMQSGRSTTELQPLTEILKDNDFCFFITLIASLSS